MTAPRLAVALLLLALTAAVDLAWLRPRQAEHERLLRLRDATLSDIAAAERATEEAEAFLGYIAGKEEGEGDWLERYRNLDAFSVLDQQRRMAGLSRTDMGLDARGEAEGLASVTYFMSLAGTHKQALAFLQSLELAPPLISVDAFVIESEDSRRVSLRLYATVFTPTGGAGS